jgi:hypothetical protein
MGIESFAEAAALILPGWQVLEVDGSDFHAPFVLSGRAPRHHRDRRASPAGDTIVADSPASPREEPAARRSHR